jgi:serine/threonine protein kinase/tetratricopeptide (TPR) repeat protein
VALKTMNRVSATALLRFKQEFRSLLDVAHPNLVTLHELICDGKNWFLTMELLDGVDLLRYIRTGFSSGSGEGTLSAPAALTGDQPLMGSTIPAGDALDAGQCTRLRSALQQLAEGIQSLHSAGKLHRDIKPSNVVVTRSHRVVLLDFGLATEQAADGLHRSTEDHLVGTAAYMAPEQAACLPVSPASDWYSVGVMLFEALTGRLPFSGSIVTILLDKQRIDPPAPAELRPGLPEDLSTLCANLLCRRPEERVAGSEVLRRLRGSSQLENRIQVGTDVPAASSITQARRRALIGRQSHRAALADAMSAMCQGQTLAVFLRGASGAGKTSLLQNFLDECIERDDALILAGRCYERESVPYKAFDSVIDALGRHLIRLTDEELAAVMPRDIGSLVRLFPGLRRIKAMQKTVRRGLPSPDPQELRRRAFAALRELLARLGDRRPLVVAIDDLQWGDVDSALLLIELLRPPDPPILLFLGTYRAEDRAGSPFLSEFFQFVRPDEVQTAGRDRPQTLAFDCREMEVEPLTDHEARELVMALIGPISASVPAEGESLADVIVREAGGNPFFVSELVRFAQAREFDETLGYLRGDSSASKELGGSNRLSVDEMLGARVRRLPDEARRMLELLAVSGGPLRLVDLSQMAEIIHDERVPLALLRAGRLIRSTGRAAADEVETYHDRVREAVVVRLEPKVVREHHRRLAKVLEESGQADFETLGMHFLGAGLPERAGAYFALAAEVAAEALAFERAALLYRQVLELPTDPPDGGRALLVGLADALANAGRGADAAHAYLRAVARAPIAEALELQRRAAMQFLISGHIDEGLAELEAVLSKVHMTLPRTPLRSLVSLLARRLMLRVRGLGFRQRDAEEILLAELTRIDVCWSAGVGLSVVDPIRGADFQARGLILALNAGEPSRIARALAMEAAHAASGGGARRKATARLLQRAEDLARPIEHPYALGMTILARGVTSYLEGRWSEAQENCDEAETTFRERSTGAVWEMNTAQAFSLWALSHQGQIAELSRRWPILLNQARQRGNRYAVMNLSSYLMSIVRLAADDPDRAQAELQDVTSQWSQRGYHVQHNDALWATVQIELYRDSGQNAWKLICESWPALRRSLLLRVQFVRTSMYFLRARAALAAAVAQGRTRPSEVASLLASAAADARKLEREKMPCPTAYARMIHGALAVLRGDLSLADRLLDQSCGLFDEVGMRLCAAAVGRRRGELIGGRHGEDEINKADLWMKQEKIHNPARMASMILTRLI